MNDISTFLQGFCLANYKFNRKGEKGGLKRISSVTVIHNEYDINCNALTNSFLSL